MAFYNNLENFNIQNKKPDDLPWHKVSPEHSQPGWHGSVMLLYVTSLFSIHGSVFKIIQAKDTRMDNPLLCEETYNA